ncbi:hypothetical protein O9929_07795 [Vibrio lentus]|nr:hypothetical protein [Vibrio lentus]
MSAQSKEGMLLRDNVYGSVDEDAERRDLFTINAMYATTLPITAASTTTRVVSKI